MNATLDAYTIAFENIYHWADCCVLFCFILKLARVLDTILIHHWLFYFWLKNQSLDNIISTQHWTYIILHFKDIPFSWLSSHYFVLFLSWLEYLIRFQYIIGCSIFVWIIKAWQHCLNATLDAYTISFQIYTIYLIVIYYLFYSQVRLSTWCAFNTSLVLYIGRIYCCLSKRYL